MMNHLNYLLLIPPSVALYFGCILSHSIPTPLYVHLPALCAVNVNADTRECMCENV